MSISPVIVVPGITASELQDEYELPPSVVWSALLNRDYGRIIPHPENQRYELREPARVSPRSPFPVIYKDLIEELRVGLSENQSGPVPVFPFSYDWRMPLRHTEKLLAAFIEEVIERASLMQYYRNGDFENHPTVSLIGHSMGGLIIAGYMADQPNERVDKVVTLGTPFHGSYEAIVKITTGTGSLDDCSRGARERHMSRMTPSLYHLLPASEGHVSDEDTLTVDFFNPDHWQRSVIRTIERYVDGWNVSGSELFETMLDKAKKHRERISALQLPEDVQARWLTIVGVGEKTRVGLRVVHNETEGPHFDLRSAERQDHWKSPDEGNPRNTGDGTVHVAGALPPFLDESRVVCVTRDDFMYYEVRDRFLAMAKGLHGLLPTMNMLHRLILRFLLGTDDPHGNTWGHRLPGVLKWDLPLDLEAKVVQPSNVLGQQNGSSRASGARLGSDVGGPSILRESE